MSGPLKKAKLRPEDNSDTLEFHYNPSLITITKSAQWNSGSSKVATGGEVEFTGTGTAQYVMSGLIFDGWASGTGDVSKVIDTLLKWTSATDASTDQNTPQPPILVLHWGSKDYVRGYLKRVVGRYTLFDPEGFPIRASADLTIVEVPPTVKSQNPTSGGISGRRAALVTGGDTLAAVAYREYGDANLWRALAVANDINDPFRIPSGTRVLVPSRAQAQDLAGRRRG
jgi:hypothetical protein